MLHKLRSKRVPARVAKSDINVTPLIDVLLVLLVIFMVITPITPQGLPATIPQEPPPDQKPAAFDKVIVLSMDRGGVVRINQEELLLGGLQARLDDIFKTRRDRTLFIQADQALLFDDVAQIIDIATGAGADRVGLMSDVIQAPGS